MSNEDGRIARGVEVDGAEDRELLITAYWKNRRLLICQIENWWKFCPWIIARSLDAGGEGEGLGVSEKGAHAPGTKEMLGVL